MEPTRREFMSQVGVFLITLVASGCEVPQTDASLNTLRASWLELKNPQLHEDTDLKHLLQQHAEALTALVKERAIDSAVAADIQVAFEEAIAHIRRSQVTCYFALPSVYTPRQDMMAQTMVLAELAQQTTIDPDTIERAGAALARDIAWLDQLRAGQRSNNPEEIQPTPTEIEAARFLAELLATTD